MRKVLIGVLVVALGVVGGYFGVSTWARMRAERELDAAFDSMRAAGATATHGPVAVNLIKRTLVIDALADADGNFDVAAAKLGLNSSYLRRLARSLNVKLP